MQETTQARRFFSNPVVGLVGTLASIIGVLLAVYFYLSSVRTRDLVYCTHPAKTIVVKTGQTSNLRVLVEGREITHDVTAVQFAFWNRGKEPIRRANVLDHIEIRTIPEVRILEASLRKRSRNVTNVQIDGASADTGRVGVSFDILERGDGAVVQLVYEGSTNVELHLDGIIEGDGEPHTLGSPPPGFESNSTVRNVFVIFMIVVTTALVAYIVRRFPYRSWSTFVMIVLGLLQVLLGLYVIYSYSGVSPPFGF